ncbi:MAG TPA: class II aldolase/adducin family protein [Firmicutes bacterium]|nr:class II aldolase/adducin family protein [Bacillota bacterium]
MSCGSQSGVVNRLCSDPELDRRRAQARRELVEFGRRAYRAGLIPGFSGNLSIRVAPGEIWVSPSGVNKGFLHESDLIAVDEEGNLLYSHGHHRPTSETPMHIAIYRIRPDVGAVCHTHAPFATAFAVAGLDLSDPILPEVVLGIGEVPLIPYATPTTQEVARVVGEVMKTHQAGLLANHGLITVGRTLAEAYARTETVEELARVVTVARLLGKVNVLPPDEVQKILALVNGNGGV